MWMQIIYKLLQTFEPSVILPTKRIFIVNISQAFPLTFFMLYTIQQIHLCNFYKFLLAACS